MLVHQRVFPKIWQTHTHFTVFFCCLGIDLRFISLFVHVSIYWIVSRIFFAMHLCVCATSIVYNDPHILPLKCSNCSCMFRLVANVLLRDDPKCFWVMDLTEGDSHQQFYWERHIRQKHQTGGSPIFSQNHRSVSSFNM